MNDDPIWRFPSLSEAGKTSARRIIFKSLLLAVAVTIFNLALLAIAVAVIVWVLKLCGVL